MKNEKLLRQQVKREYYLPEALCWVVGICLLICMEPEGEHLFSLCPVSWLLESGCPGCGLGHAVAFIFKGDFAASWEAHPLGAPAILILIGRIYSLLKKSVFLSSNQPKQ